MPRQHFPAALVGPNLLLRESHSRLLQKSSFNIVELASCIDGLVPTALPLDRTILLIIETCDRPSDACGQIEHFRQDHPLGRVVVLANHCAPANMARVLRSAASGFFATIAARDDFIKSLELVMEGQIILPSEEPSSIIVHGTKGVGETTSACDVIDLSNDARVEMPLVMDSADMLQSSARELYILRCLTEGNSNKVIARECDIAERTVKVQVKAILHKIKVENQTQAAIWAMNNEFEVRPAQADQPYGLILDGPVVKAKFGTRKIGSTMQSMKSNRIERGANHIR